MNELSAAWQVPEIAALLPDQYFADGFIFAIAASPDIPLPERWMPWLIEQNTTQLSLSAAHADVLADALMGGLRAHLNRMRLDTSLLPDYLPAAGLSDTVSQAISAWLSGLVAAHRHLEPVWGTAWQNLQQTETLTPGQEDPSLRLRRCLKLFTTLADPQLALAQRSETEAAHLNNSWPSLLAHLPGMLKEYVALAGELAGALPNQFEMFSKTRSD